MKTFKHLKLLTILFLLLFLISHVFSQKQTNDTISLDEAVITGSKIKVARKLIPLSVSQITQHEIENTGEINVLPTISTYVPGVFVTERNILGFGVSTGSSGAINIRGVGNNPNTGVLVLIDGHPQYQGIFGHPLPDAYVFSDVEKVEVIRGPASILYGSNAMGGVVNIITKKQHQDGINSTINASYGSYNTQQYSAIIGYKKNKLIVFASLNHDRTDGIRDSTEFKITNGYTKIGYTINNHFNITGDFNLAHFTANDNGSIYKPEFLGMEITRGKTALSIENKFENIEGAMKVYHNFGTHDLSDGWYSTDNNSGAMLYQTINLFKGNHLTAGIDLKQYGGKGNNGKARDSLIHIEEYAFYAFMHQSILENLSISAGIRLENNSKFGNEVVPMAGINYNPSSTTTIKGSVSKGFRSPTMMELFLFVPNPDLKPERMINCELGWLQSFMYSRLQTELTVFSAKGENMIQVINFSRQNSGAFSNKGVELSVKYNASKNLNFHGNYSYLNTEDPILAAPEHQINLSANYGYKIFNFNFITQHINTLYTNVSPDITTSYTLVNTRINAKVQKNTSVFVMLNNLLNEKYEINYGYPMPKMNFSAGLKFQL